MIEHAQHLVPAILKVSALVAAGKKLDNATLDTDYVAAIVLGVEAECVDNDKR